MAFVSKSRLHFEEAVDIIFLRVYLFAYQLQEADGRANILVNNEGALDVLKSLSVKWLSEKSVWH